MDRFNGPSPAKSREIESPNLSSSGKICQRGTRIRKFQIVKVFKANLARKDLSFITWIWCSCSQSGALMPPNFGRSQPLLHWNLSFSIDICKRTFSKYSASSRAQGISHDQLTLIWDHRRLEAFPWRRWREMYSNSCQIQWSPQGGTSSVIPGHPTMYAPWDGPAPFQGDCWTMIKPGPKFDQP